MLGSVFAVMDQAQLLLVFGLQELGSEFRDSVRDRTCVLDILLPWHAGCVAHLSDFLALVATGNAIQSRHLRLWWDSAFYIATKSWWIYRKRNLLLEKCLRSLFVVSRWCCHKPRVKVLASSWTEKCDLIVLFICWPTDRPVCGLRVNADIIYGVVEEIYLRVVLLNLLLDMISIIYCISLTYWCVQLLSANLERILKFDSCNEADQSARNPTMLPRNSFRWSSPSTTLLWSDWVFLL